MASISDVGGAVMTIQEVSAQMIECLKELKELTGSNDFCVTLNKPTVQMFNKDRFDSLDGEIVYKIRQCNDYPCQAEKTINGVTYFRLLTQSEYEDLGLDWCLV
jgi:hypothetical protein